MPQRYVCGNCGHRFESEEKESIECPSCFWSTSVRKEEEVKSAPAAAPAPETARTPFRPNLSGLASVVRILPKLILIALALGIVFLGVRWGGALLSKKKSAVKTEIKASDLAEEAQTSSGNVPPAAAAAEKPAGLTEQESSLLNQTIPLEFSEILTPDEKNILKHSVQFQTGWSEKLPSQAWTPENFRQMIAEQEKFYRITFPRSYKKKLNRLFETKYVAAAEAFKAGNLAESRNLFIESLAFPIYGDQQKHRVALTMLRPFINDTLAKVGSIQSMLSEKNIREKESAANALYGKVLEDIRAEHWADALQSAGDFEKGVREIEAMPPAPAAPFPPTIGQLDRDIAFAVTSIAQPQSAAKADLAAALSDVQQKRKVLQKLQPEALQLEISKYQSAMERIQAGQWDDARSELQTIQFPPALADDAARKIALIHKINTAGAAPPADSSPQNR